MPDAPGPHRFVGSGGRRAPLHDPRRLRLGDRFKYRFSATAVAAQPDMDGDGDVDLLDLAHLQACATGEAGPPATKCQDADLDGDEDVDADDQAILLDCLSGVDVPAAPACTP